MGLAQDEPPEENAALANTLAEDFWKTQLGHLQTPDPNNLQDDECVSFQLLSVWLFSAAYKTNAGGASSYIVSCTSRMWENCLESYTSLFFQPHDNSPLHGLPRLLRGGQNPGHLGLQHMKPD